MLPEAIHGELRELQVWMGEARLPSPELPEPFAASHQFAFWFALQAFMLLEYFQLQPDIAARATPDSLTSAMHRFGNVVRQFLGMPLPGPRQGTPLALTPSWFSLAGRAVGGSNWCRHADKTLVPMDIIRNVDLPGYADLHMNCDDRHRSEYDETAGILPQPLHKTM